MDKAIPKSTQHKEKTKRLVKSALITTVCLAVVCLIISFLKLSLKRSELVVSTVDTGTIEVTLNASGVVAPAFEEIINSPIDSRIVEVYCKGGDSLEAGTSIMKLDLQSVETDYNKMVDEEQMRCLQLEQLRISNRVKLSEMEMQLKIARMELNRKAVELRNEQYLDSLGAGTSDKVLQAELNYNVGKLQLEENEQKYLNEQDLSASDLRVKELELMIFRKSLAEMKRTLDEAKISAPRKAILTYVNNEIGAKVSKGQRIAVVSNLSHYKIEAEIADTYGDRISVGYKTFVKIGTETLEGLVSDVTPLSKNGVISFSIQLYEDNHRRLRSGLKTDVYVMESLKDNVLRIKNDSYYAGPGNYELFVVSGKELIKKEIRLGSSRSDYSSNRKATDRRSLDKIQKQSFQSS